MYTNSKTTTSGTGIPRDLSVDEKQTSIDRMKNIILCVSSPRKSSIDKEKENDPKNGMKNKNMMLCMASSRKSSEEDKKNKSTDELYFVD